MKKWEYESIQSTTHGSLVVECDEFGEERWELVNVVFDTEGEYYVAFLKREVQNG